MYKDCNSDEFCGNGMYDAIDYKPELSETYLSEAEQEASEIKQNDSALNETVSEETATSQDLPATNGDTGLIAWIKANPLAAAAVGAGVFLLFFDKKEGRRR